MSFSKTCGISARIAILASVAGLMQGADGAAVPRVSHSASFAKAFQSGSLYPTWSGGMMIAPGDSSADASTKEQTRTVFFDRQGVQAGSVTFWVDGAAKVRVRSVAVDAKRRVLAGGNAVASDGKLAGFMILTDLSGKPGLTIRLNPYAPESVCFGEDGTLWALVSLIDMDGSSVGTDYPILRQYSAEGKLLQAVLARSRFKGGIPPALNTGGGGEVIMQANRSHLGILFGHANLWVEVDGQGSVKELSFEGLPFLGPQGDATGRSKSFGGLAFLDSGAVFVSQSDALTSGLYRLDKKIGRWILVEGTQGSLDDGAVSVLHGKEGGELVFSSTKLGRGSLYWARFE